MKRIIALSGLLCCALVTTPASSQVLLEMSQITCKEYEALEPGDKGLISAWILGYFNASRNLNIVQERYIDRNLEKLNEYCHHHKESGILADIEKIGH
jgi:acid stress chaperone HdeB